MNKVVSTTKLRMQVKEARSLHSTSTGNARCFKAFSNKKRRHVVT